MCVLVLGLLAFWAAPAAAEFTSNDVGCAGSAVITDGAKQYTIDAKDTVAKVSAAGTADYQGSVSTVTHHHSGSIRLKVGPAGVTLGSWGPSANASNQSSKAGTKKLPAALGDVPPGKYEVTGQHRGDEGGCAGRMTLDVQAPASNPIVLGSLGLTAITGAGFLLALRAVPAKAVAR